tara:strand:+ start:259 stop:651 length:393 start_codon:yes stop_codon:yes gene_type:complete
MIKLKDLLLEKSFRSQRDFGNQKYWNVTKLFTVQAYTGEYKGTGQYYGGFGRGSSELQKAITKKLDVKPGMQFGNLPGGLFVVDDRKKKAWQIQDGSFSINDKFVEPKTSKIVDFTLWKNYKPYKDLNKR